MIPARPERVLTAIRLLWLLWILPAVLITVRAERLPIKTYTTADGLPRDQINRIVKDSRGYLWFCTAEGLSRFDGYKFTNYGKENGLPDRRVNDFLETRAGVYWVATGEGLCRFNGDSSQATGNTGSGTSQRFVLLYPGDSPRRLYISDLYEDRNGTVWCGTHEGLYRLDQVNGQWIFSFVDIIKPARNVEDNTLVKAILEDRRGSLWVSTTSGLYRLRPDGLTESYNDREGLPVQQIMPALLEDDAGRIWVGMRTGLYQLVVDPAPNRLAVERVFTKKDGLTSDHIVSLIQSSDSQLWIGTEKGLDRFGHDASRGGRIFQRYTAANSLSDIAIRALAEDHDGNLWIGTESGGAMKLALNGYTSYTEADGLSGTRIASIIENQQGELCVISSDGSINRFDRSRFTAFRPALPKNVTYLGWGWYQTAFQDHIGEWWLNTGGGVVRYPRVKTLEQLAHAQPKAIYTTRDGLPGDDIFRLFEDSRGDIWISTVAKPGWGVVRWERATETLHRYSTADGILDSAATAFCEDRAGNLWMGFYDGGLTRFSAGRFTRFTVPDGLPAGFIRGLFIDSGGRLWIATGDGGIARVDDPNAERPRFVTYTTADGLSSNQATCLTEDRWGNIYIGTGRGVSRLDPATGHIKQYTTADGLANNFVNVCFRDREGSLWFGTLQGLSRLIPRVDPPTSPPPILISAFRIAGVTQPISELGATEVQGPELDASRNQIQIDFVGVRLGAGESLRYQYRLEGAEQDWSALTDQRTVNYPNLSAGAYRFLVRAVSSDGTLSDSPAILYFRILSPIWRRWWFLTIAAMIVASVIFAFAHSRYQRLKTLRESENRFRMLAETASDAIITIDEQSQIVLVNHSAERVFGYTISEMIGANLATFMPEHLLHLRRTGLDRSDASWVGIELRGMHKDQREIPLEVSFGEFTREGRRYVTAIARDITERKHAEEMRAWNARCSLLRAEVGHAMAESAMLEVILQRCADAIVRNLEGAFSGIWLLNQEQGVLELQSGAGVHSDIGDPHGRVPVGRFDVGQIAEKGAPFLTNDLLTDRHVSDLQWAQREGMVAFAGYPLLVGNHLVGVVGMFARHTLREGALEALGSVADTIAHGIERNRAEEALTRSREDRLAELERVRRRIATDLHDDIGSSLTQITILSEVAQKHVGGGDKQGADALTRIIVVSNELVDAMSDIVWAINPKKDHLSDLVQRMRRFASDVFAPRNIAFDFHAPGAGNDIELGANLRREIFLVFKESVNNVVKHSGCSRAEIDFHVDRDWLDLRVSDDGMGFDTAMAATGGPEGRTQGRGGNGMLSMHKRAAEMGGEFKVTSSRGHGTTSSLKVPVNR